VEVQANAQEGCHGEGQGEVQRGAEGVVQRRTAWWLEQTQASVPARGQAPKKAPGEPQGQPGEGAQGEPSGRVRAWRREAGPKKARMKEQPPWRPLPHRPSGSTRQKLYSANKRRKKQSNRTVGRQEKGPAEWGVITHAASAPILARLD